jgi:hypothetical protein
MTDDTTEFIHIRVGGGATPEDYEEIGKWAGEAFPDHEVYVTGDHVSIAEIPALDSFADELTDRIKREVVDELTSELRSDPS